MSSSGHAYYPSDASAASPRVVLRKRTLSDTCKPWIALIQQAAKLCSEANLPTQRGDSVQLLESIADFALAIDGWASSLAIPEEDRGSTKVCRTCDVPVYPAHMRKALLTDLLLESIDALYPALHTSLALRLYEAQNSRLILRSGVSPGWEPDHAAVQKFVVRTQRNSAPSAF